MHDEAYIPRFWERVDKTDACWLWTGGLQEKGYGLVAVKIDGKWRNRLSHRVAYFLEHNDWPESLHHTCETKRCVNPAHLLPTTRREHQSRYHVGDSCSRGHALEGDNVRIVERPDRAPYRICRVCVRETERRSEQARRERCAAQGHPRRATSKRGLCMCGWTTTTDMGD